MNVLKYLEMNSLDDLTNEFGIKIAQNEKYPNLYCLNYCQIKSPKTNPIVQECRSLVIEYTGFDPLIDCKAEWKIVSRSFDRFFNYGEAGAGDDDNINKMIAYEKVDGSLVGLFYYNGEWLYRTRSMIMPAPDMIVNGFGDLSWKDLIEETVLGPVDKQVLDTHLTYIFEVVSPENRVVTRYTERKAYLLAKRNNEFGHYVANETTIWALPEVYLFDTYENCVIAAKELRDLNEGYVLYYQGQPQMKIKNPAYVAAHHLRGETALTARRVIDLIVMNEADEYLSIFPEDKVIFDKYRHNYNTLQTVAEIIWDEQKHLVDNRKEFALAVKDFKFSAFLFQRMQTPDVSFEKWFTSLYKATQYKLLENNG